MEKQGKILQRAGILILAIMLLWPALVRAETISTYSDAYVVMDADTGQILMEKNMDKREYPASITKVLTVALALEKCQLDEKVTVSQAAVDAVESGSSHIALSPGEEVTIEQMAYAAMLPSANDAANVLAEAAGGSMEAFVQMMNDKASELGVEDTHFVNPSGLHDPQHYITAKDFAQVTRWALTVPGFREVFGADEYTMAPTNLQPEERYFGTSNCLTVTSAYEYEGATGGKLGWTPEANHTIAAVAHRGEMELVIVALNSEGKWSKFKDCVALYDACFDGYSQVEVPKEAYSVADEIEVTRDGQAVGKLRLQLPETLKADLPKGVQADQLRVEHNFPGQIAEPVSLEPMLSVYHGDTLLYSTSLEYSSEALEVSAPLEPDKAEKDVKVSSWIRYAVIGVFVLFVLVCWRRAVLLRRRARRRRQRDRRLGRTI